MFIINVWMFYASYNYHQELAEYFIMDSLFIITM